MPSNQQPSDDRYNRYCDLCAADIPQEPEPRLALPFDLQLSAYHQLRHTDTSVAFQDQGNFGPPHLTGAAVPIIFDNTVPYAPVYTIERKPRGQPIFTRSAVVKVTRSVYSGTDSHKFIESFDRVIGVQFEGAHVNHNCTFIDILKFHQAISL